MPLVKVTAGNGQEDKENSSLSSTKDQEGQASPCSSSGASCAKCPECCGGYENKNPEAIVASSTGAVLLKNTSQETFLIQGVPTSWYRLKTMF